MWRQVVFSFRSVHLSTAQLSEVCVCVGVYPKLLFCQSALKGCLAKHRTYITATFQAVKAQEIGMARERQGPTHSLDGTYILHYALVVLDLFSWASKLQLPEGALLQCGLHGQHAPGATDGGRLSCKTARAAGGIQPPPKLCRLSNDGVVSALRFSLCRHCRKGSSVRSSWSTCAE